MSDPSYEVLTKRGRCLLSYSDDKDKEKDKYNDKDRKSSKMNRSMYTDLSVNVHMLRCPLLISTPTVHFKTKTITNIKTKTKTKTVTKTKTTFLKDTTCAMFLKSWGFKDIKYDIISTSSAYHQCIISTSSAYHPCISVSSVNHQCIIIAS